MCVRLDFQIKTDPFCLHYTLSTQFKIGVPARDCGAGNACPKTKQAPKGLSMVKWFQTQAALAAVA